jgi:GT2 family glycosyltransferase
MGLPRLSTGSKFFFEGKSKFWIQGVSYGPFCPRDRTGAPFPSPEEVGKDFIQMREAGVNVIRLYEIPPGWFLDKAHEHGLRLFITFPWSKRTRFLDRSVKRGIRDRLAQVAKTFQGHPALAGYFVDNEIPADLCRWYGPRRVEGFLDSLVQTLKERDPLALVSYGNFPTTEYILPSSVDFYSYNVYLHDRQALSRYLARLQNLVGEKPLILSEFGMDTQRNSELAQATYLREQWEEILLGGLAGAILFAWTDEWYTDGGPVTDWAFGVVREDRSPKPSYWTLRELWKEAPGELYRRLPGRSLPRATVAVCTYNGASTLADCLRSLEHLSYPDYEVIVVDDGSKDRTQSILAEFPWVRKVRQENLGLSAARNRAIAEATGEVIAFTDADCIADPDWLYYLVASLQKGDFVGVGGPNVSPPAKNWVEATVGAAPGSPSHVLISDHEAEHVPGCNMAFYKRALCEVGGFDPQFRAAGDDVDLCWRLRETGYRIAFSPAAIVWHHRRSTVRAYLKQQEGYGHAEALLRFKHLHYFGPTGSALWKGRVYAQNRLIPLWERPVIYHGIFGTGSFQLLYGSPDSPWGSLFGSFEWIFFGMTILGLSFFLPSLRLIPPLFFAPTLLWALNYMARAVLQERYDGVPSRVLLFLLVILQPVVRGWARYRTWLLGKATPPGQPLPKLAFSLGLRPGPREFAFWTDTGKGRIELLAALEKNLKKEGWSFALDTGWTHWDIHIFANRWWGIRMRTLTEIYPKGGRLTVVTAKLLPSLLFWTVTAAGYGGAFFLGKEGAGGPLPWALACTGLLGFVYLQGSALRHRLGELLSRTAQELGFQVLPSSFLRQRRKEKAFFRRTDPNLTP